MSIYLWFYKSKGGGGSFWGSGGDVFKIFRKEEMDFAIFL